MLFKQFLPRLKGAQLEGFDSVRKLNMKFNQKRLSHGLEPVQLEVVCKDELELRLQD
jgi:hypothetical protein